ncbi:MAG: hypothetical protein ACYDDA_13280 [Acidiferrobacteraceae bacterium]
MMLSYDPLGEWIEAVLEAKRRRRDRWILVGRAALGLLLGIFFGFLGLLALVGLWGILVGCP